MINHFGTRVLHLNDILNITHLYVYNFNKRTLSYYCNKIWLRRINENYFKKVLWNSTIPQQLFAKKSTIMGD